MKCIRDCGNEAGYDKRIGFTPCDECIAKDRSIQIKKPPEFYTLSKMYRIQGQRDDFAKDILQPIGDDGKPSKDFAEAYPEYRDDYFTPEELKSL